MILLMGMELCEETHEHGDPENGPKSSASAQTQWTSDGSFMLTGHGGRQEEKQSKHEKEIWKIFRPFQEHPRFVLLVFGILLAILLIASGVIGYFLRKYLESPASSHRVSCSDSWVGYEGKCYNFSEIEGTWNFSQSNCSSFGASLALIDSQRELDFLKRFKGSAHYWIGLHRDAVGEPWKWSNGTIFNGWFKVTADGLCACLDDGVSSTWCITQRNWICSKSL